ncbi:MAG TPA: DHA2 family efflux MFS transporter permease subunit [Candidatus Limnocylindrales bacterium]|nr:DHA2 family efflux MFS transporter permease subunit [Candidatus Limnocylindrales bacterium]
MLGICSLAAFMAFLDVTIVNVAFPNMEQYFHAIDRASLSWVLSGYNVVFSAMLVPAGRLADVFGRRRVFLYGLALFVLASLGAALSPIVWLLVAMRIVQAVGAAAVIPASIALLLAEYPPSKRLTATAILGACAAAAGAFGPTVGGLLVEAMDWRLVFLVNVPLGVALMIWSAIVLRGSAERLRSTMPDLLGTVTLTAGLGAVVMVIVQGDGWGWNSARTLLTGICGLALLAYAIKRSARHPAPVVELGLLRLRPVAVGNLGLLIFATAIYGKILVDVLYLTGVWHLRPALAGLALAPGPLITTACAPIAGRLAERYGARLIAGIGAVVFALGCVWFAAVPGTEVAYFSQWLPGSVLTGIGNAMTFPILTGVAVSSLPYARFATGSAVNAAARQVGAVLGVAIVVAILGVDDSALNQLVLLRAFWVIGFTASLTAIVTLLWLPRENTALDLDAGPSLPQEARVL